MLTALIIKSCFKIPLGGGIIIIIYYLLELNMEGWGNKGSRVLWL